MKWKVFWDSNDERMYSSIMSLWICAKHSVDTDRALLSSGMCYFMLLHIV